MELSINGLNTSVTDTGAGDRGTVLFLNGWATRTARYRRVFDLLSALGYRVVGFDAPGVGGTEEPREPMTLEDYAAFALAVCHRLELREAILFGHSHGGRTALLMLEDEHSPLKCPRAVLMDSAGIRNPPTGKQKVVQGAYKAVKFLGTSQLTAPLFGDLYEEWRGKRASADYKAASPVMRQTLQHILGRDLRAGMGRITAETLLLWGDRDEDTPLSYGQEMERLIPGAGLAVIKDAGHFCFEDNWPQFEAVLRAFFAPQSN